MKSFSKYMHMVGILIIMGMLASCSDDPETAVPSDSSWNEEAPSHCERAVLVYLLADNSLGLDGYDRENLAEMIQAAKDGLLGENRLIVYHDDRKADRPMLKEVTPRGLKILKEYDGTRVSTSPERMEEVISDFKTVAPADRYGLIFWSHATGWPLANSVNPSDIRPLWVGEDRGHFMDVTDLAAVLEGAGFDYIYFDCCHMASVEALYELRRSADIFAASAAELPAEGMPYYQALPYLMGGDADLVAAARVTFSKYDALTGVNRTSTMSVVRADELENLAAATAEVYDRHPVPASGYSGQPFERRKRNGEPCYLFDFKDYLEHLTTTDDKEALDADILRWKDALGRAVIYQASTPWIFNEIKVDAHCGLTTYILQSPADASTNGYCNLQWYRDVVSRLY